LYQLLLVAQMDGATGELSAVLVCKKCRQREFLPVKCSETEYVQEPAAFGAHHRALKIWP